MFISDEVNVMLGELLEMVGEVAYKENNRDFAWKLKQIEDKLFVESRLPQRLHAECVKYLEGTDIVTLNVASIENTCNSGDPIVSFSVEAIKCALNIKFSNIFNEAEFRCYIDVNKEMKHITFNDPFACRHYDNLLRELVPGYSNELCAQELIEEYTCSNYVEHKFLKQIKAYAQNCDTRFANYNPLKAQKSIAFICMLMEMRKHDIADAIEKKSISAYMKTYSAKPFKFDISYDKSTLFVMIYTSSMRAVNAYISLNDDLIEFNHHWSAINW